LNATLRTAFIIATLFAAALFALTLRATGSNRELIPYTGRWAGGFEIDTVTQGPATEEVKRQNRLTGYLQVYLTGRKYKLHLEGIQQGIDIDGTWTAKGRRIILTPKEVKIDDRGGPEMRDPNKPYLPNEDVTAAYSKPIVLDQSEDKQSFQGLSVTVSRFIGKHAFKR
jgi:hypothetical protein